jgi:phosphoglucosamine mutase
MKKFPQLLINVAIENRIDIDKDPRIKEALLKAEKELNKRGRVLLRNSGTENVVRVMVEGDDEALINRVALELADVVRLCTKK